MSVSMRPFDIPGWATVVWCLCITLFFVLSLYVWKDRTTNRNDNAVIVRRAISATVVCLVTPLCMLSIPTKPGAPELLDIIGLIPDIMSMLYSVALVLILFIGPIVRRSIDAYRKRKLPRFNSNSGETWPMLIRDVFIAPITEEFAFRACMCPVLLSGGLSTTLTIFICPIFFGIAHLHHVREHVKINGYTMNEAIQISFGQFMLTSVFGTFATFLFLRTGSFYGPFLAHAICNGFGVPKFHLAWTHKHRIIVCTSFFIGLVGFALLMYYLITTEVNNLSSYYWI